MRNRLIVIALMPIIITFWIIGWTLVQIGSQNKPPKTQTTEKDGIEVTSVLYEECNA